MREAAKFCAELGFDGIDINMGCPDRSIEKQGAGAAMIKTPHIAANIIQAVKDGIADAGKQIPVSVKTRVGYNTVQIDEWVPFLLSQNIASLTIHTRTRKEMSKVAARWEHVKEAVAIRDRMGVKTKIIGNGDVRDVAHGRMLAEQTGCDGIMIGRAIFGNPWLFANLRNEEIVPAKSLAQGRRAEQSNFLARKYAWFLRALFRRGEDSKQTAKYWLNTTTTIPVEERLRVLVEHTNLYMELLGDIKNFAIMKKHYKAYVNGFDGAKELRVRLMEAKDAAEVEAIVSDFLA
jgi:tRNA-dihydrouridine synthase